VQGASGSSGQGLHDGRRQIVTFRLSCGMLPVGDRNGDNQPSIHGVQQPLLLVGQIRGPGYCICSTVLLCRKQVTSKTQQCMQHPNKSPELLQPQAKQTTG
jgi:hypothetical protein